MDEAELSRYSKSVLEVMDELAPRFGQRRTESGAMEFYLDSPVAAVPELVISTADDELTLHFSLGHWHVSYQGEPTSARESVEKTLHLVDEIETESRIAVEAREGRLGRRKFCGLVDLAKYHELRESGRLRKAVSWRGTYASSA